MKRMKLPLLYILSVLLSVLPVLIYFIVNHDRYIRSVPEGIKSFNPTLSLGRITISP